MVKKSAGVFVAAGFNFNPAFMGGCCRTGKLARRTISVKLGRINIGVVEHPPLQQKAPVHAEPLHRVVIKIQGGALFLERAFTDFEGVRYLYVTALQVAQPASL